MFNTLIVDRSILAINMYRLLLEPLGASFETTKDIEDALLWLKGKKIELAIFNSNTFRKKSEDRLISLFNDKSVKKIPKIFLCLADEKKWHKKLNELQKAMVLIRPVHPDDFLKAIKKRK